ncbi:leucine zipper putative tumor suppressor 2-like [Centruroides sculpturatus]|uniref:leucine zipper putative tumor suppressor 2-like n=1 Tax=Centruroides sculpturatus TaxID=218467 RepID=UPI000C6CB185|nr:leucine zipper putative tumor suppressor 2-like [Centruroides sculpturatus]XP_023242236.1 leucine zipper putative tumor suppressor 2-like [Centruroides sculpturatus]
MSTNATPEAQSGDDCLPTTNRDSPISSGTGSMRGCNHGNRTSDSSDESHIYEDIGDSQGPPKLAPISGVLGSKDRSVVRPVAFKPVVSTPSVRYATPAPRMGSSAQPSPYSSVSYPLEDDHRSLTYSVDSCIKISDLFQGQVTGGGSGFQLDDFTQTPSPSDSGIAELEAMLREKDSEISYLRETLEQNEQVIFKVYEEKEQSWQRELKRLKAVYENKLRACQQRMAKAEQMVSVQNYQIQQEKRKLQVELDESKKEKEASGEQIERLRQELAIVKAQLEETEWSLCQKTGEVSLLKSQLKDSQGDQTSRVAEMLTLKSQLRETRQLLEEKEKREAELEERLLQAQQQLEQALQNFQLQSREIQLDREGRCGAVGQMKQEVDRLRNELATVGREYELARENIEMERIQWMEEKEKVIRYQKLLQLNYIQMYKRNKTLESEVEQLSLELELEGRDAKSLANGESHC